MRVDLGKGKVRPVFTLAVGLGTLLAVLIGSPAPSKAQDATPEFSVFDMPVLSESLAFVFQNLRSGNFDTAESTLREVIEKYPDRAQNYYLLASVLAIRNRKEEALDMLTLSIDKGFGNSELLQTDSNLATIRNTPRFKELLERVVKESAEQKTPPDRRTVALHLVKQNEALVSASNTVWDPRIGMLKTGFRFAPKSDSSLVQNLNHPVSQLINEWYQAGKAAGNQGDIYDNRDRGHSTLDRNLLPQLGIVTYDEAAKAADIDYGLNNKILFNSITFGNSSTAVTKGPLWRSLARVATTVPRNAQILYLQYVQNQMYIYPSVQDYTSKYGDLFIANTPYMLVSDGRSGSDKPLLQIVAGILAAFQPEVKEYLRKNKLVMPTVQMLFRSGNLRLFRELEYLTHKAHPPVFHVKDVDMPLIVRKTNALKIEDVPPMVKLSIVSDSKPVPGIDDFSRIKEETLFATPGAIARVVRSTAEKTRMVISTQNTIVPTGQKVKYHWVVLRGDKERISITPQNEDGTIAEITVPWHVPFPSPNPPNLMTNRVEIAVFADNGKNISAPAFVNFLFPANQARTYDEKGRIQSIDHREGQTKKYVDPQIYAHRNWRDDYEYDDEGNLTGWTRTRNKSTDRFTRHGAKVIETDSLGRPLKAEVTNYDVNQSKRGDAIVSEKPTNEFLYYVYSGPDDLLGELKPRQ